MHKSTLVTAGLVLALSGCGAASPATGAPFAGAPVAAQSPAALSRAQQKAAFVAISAKLYVDLHAYNSELALLGPTDRQAYIDASAILADKIRSASTTLASTGFTGQAAVDVRALVVAYTTLGDDLRIDSSPDLGLGAWAPRITRDFAAVSAAIDLASADLTE